MEIGLRKTTYEDLATQRADYLLSTMVPLDGMWENAFFPMAIHSKIVHDKQSIGFCSINAEGKLLGFNVDDSALQRAAFSQCIEELEPSGAFASTAEPAYLSLCADHQISMSVNALMYVENDEHQIAPSTPSGTNVRAARPDDLEVAISFGVAAIEANREWLSGYFDERIKKNELFGLWAGTELIATGECRMSPNQPQVADVGMIVGAGYRKRGLATFMLQYLRSIGRHKELELICSTESSNIGAQKAIERAGFVSRHRILEFTF